MAVAVPTPKGDPKSGESANQPLVPGLDPSSVETSLEDDARRMRAIANGDKGVFEQVYEAHQRRLLRVAYGVLLNANDAREVVQDAFVRLWEHADRWEPKAEIGAWLHRVVVNLCLDLRRRFVRAGRHVLLLGDAREPSSSLASPEIAAATSEAMVIVERSLRSMSMKQRAVACLHLESDLRPTELASLVDLTPNAARVTLHRALTRLREDLNAAGIEGSFRRAAQQDDSAHQRRG